MTNTIIKEMLFEWDGVDISLNKFYSAPHWIIRKKEKDFWKMFFGRMPIESSRKIDKYQITIYYNSRLDCDNVVLHAKFFCDYLREIGLVEDDSKKFYRGLHIIPDETLGKKHYKLYLQIISYANKEV